MEFVKDWVASCGEDEGAYIELLENEDLINAIFQFLEDELNHSGIEVLLKELCDILHHIYSLNDPQYTKAVVAFLPTLVWAYLHSFLHSMQKNSQSLEVLLLFIHNQESYNTVDHIPVKEGFRIPTLALGSLYHNPALLQNNVLTEAALRRLEEGHSVQWRPIPVVDAMTAYSRLPVLATLLHVYNRYTPVLKALFLTALCTAASRITLMGFRKLLKSESTKSLPSLGDGLSSPEKRFPVSVDLLLELLTAAYVSMYNGCSDAAAQTIKDIEWRARYELYPEVLLVTSAIRNSTNNFSGEAGPMGIHVQTSLREKAPAMSKNLITNASFRTKKLPEDIPVQAGSPDSVGTGPLASIVEEKDKEKKEEKEEATSKGLKGIPLRIGQKVLPRASPLVLSKREPISNNIEMEELQS
ncbi:unnamed protein product [Darwinula stevensoni]|uniref:Hyccin n=1 Tax=Darwinula stevensoni TaxID=69355 RepID=A0A7R8ZXP4_9CRUS|nr:unnamed protein product [Darwinula stevensoni]CAG0879792.1 unnamed protein product [Darwinula stevensoni]